MCYLLYDAMPQNYEKMGLSKEMSARFYDFTTCFLYPVAG